MVGRLGMRYLSAIRKVPGMSFLFGDGKMGNGDAAFVCLPRLGTGEAPGGYCCFVVLSRAVFFGVFYAARCFLIAVGCEVISMLLDFVALTRTFLYERLSAM